MIKTIITVLLLAITIKLDTANAVTVEDRLPEGKNATTSVVMTKNEVKALIDKIALEKAVSADMLNTIIECESQYNPKALGDGGHSRGLVQIFDSYHPTVTHEQAYDPEFAITFLADKLKVGKGHLWTCYRSNYGDN